MSTGGHKSFVGQERIGIVVGGHSMTPLGIAGDNSGKLIVKDPTTMGDNVRITDLPFSIRDRAADYFSQCSTPGLLDPGKVVYLKGDLGGKLKIVGIADETYQEGGVPENNSLISPFLSVINLINPNVWQPPNLTKTYNRGAQVYNATEKNPYSHGMLRGLPATGTTFPLLGARIPNETGIPTAIQNFSNILTGGMLGNLLGVAMNLGLMLTSLKNNPAQFQRATQNMPRETRDAFESLINMSQDVVTEGDPSTISLTSFRVDPNTFVDNVATVYAQCTSLNDLIECTAELVSNTEYHGLSNYDIVRVEYETPFGNSTIFINPTGELYEAPDANTANAQNNYIESATSYPATNSGGSGNQQTLSQIAFALSLLSSVTGMPIFGAGARIMMLLFSRMPAAQLAGAIQLLTSVNSIIATKTVNPITHLTGGNPFRGFPLG